MSLVSNMNEKEGRQRVITFVCTGNICRSPMAEYLFRSALELESDPKLRSLRSASAGIAAPNGSPASTNAILAMQPLGIDLAPHRSRLLTQQIVDNSFAIFCMTPSHVAVIEDNFQVSTPHLFLLRELIPNSNDRSLPDPFGGTLAEYERCRNAIEEAIPSIIQYLKHVIA